MRVVRYRQGEAGRGLVNSEDPPEAVSVPCATPRVWAGGQRLSAGEVLSLPVHEQMIAVRAYPVIDGKVQTGGVALKIFGTFLGHYTLKLNYESFRFG